MNDETLYNVRTGNINGGKIVRKFAVRYILVTETETTIKTYHVSPYVMFHRLLTDSYMTYI